MENTYSQNVSNVELESITFFRFSSDFILLCSRQIEQLNLNSFNVFIKFASELLACVSVFFLTVLGKEI